VSSDAATVTLPRTMRAAVRAEFGRAFRPPYETPGVVVMNGLLMTGCWLLLPRSWFFDFTGTMAFPIILAGWMYADVPATNVFGPDSRRILAAFDDGRELRLLLFAKNAVLWLFVTPLCIAIALGLGVAEHQAIVTALSIVVIALAPLGVLGLSGILGTYFPYHPLPVRWRWEHRRDRRMLVRWGTLVLLPYVLVPGLAVVVLAPTLEAWSKLSDKDIRKLSNLDFAVGALIACAVGVALWIVGHRAVVILARRRGERLTSFLADPNRG
jgi:hypothetical protein